MLITISADPVKKRKLIIQLVKEELEALKERLPILRNLERIESTNKGKLKAKAKAKAVQKQIRKKQKSLKDERAKLRKLRNG
tara:strand:- start:1462 stop:1707 length:246 start_codon:yes stop_codon:yes gene_type:complete